MVSERFAIAQVTPHPWEDTHEVNAFVRSLSDELARRGHRMVVLAPSRSPELVRESRRLIRAGELFDPDGGVRVLGVGELLPLAPARRGMPPAPPLDVARTLDAVLAQAPFDFVHVHEPFAPSTASLALRHSRALNVGTFHAPAERVISTQVARRFVERFFGRLDARTASFDATRELMERAFPARYEVIGPGAELDDARARRRRRPSTSRSSTTRTGTRCGCSCARCAGCPTTSSGARPSSPPPGRGRARCARRGCATASRCSTTEHDGEAELLASADVLVAASAGQAPAPGLLVRALGAGAVPVAARLPAYEEILRDGERGLLFEPGDVDTLCAQLVRLIGDPGLRDRLRTAAPVVGWDAVAARFEAVYDAVAARRHPPRKSSIPADAQADRRRPAHAHGPLERLRDAGRGAARHRARAGAGRDRGDRPQRGVGRARGAGQGRGVRRQGHRRRGGQDRRRRARSSACSSRRRSRAGSRWRRRSPRSGARAASSTCRTRSTGCTPCPTTSTCWRSSRTSTRSRSSTRASRSPPTTRRRCGSRPSTASSAAPARTRTSRRASAPCASGCATSTGRRSSSTRSPTPTSSAARARSTTPRCRR